VERKKGQIKGGRDDLPTTVPFGMRIIELAEERRAKDGKYHCEHNCMLKESDMQAPFCLGWHP
jgi:hypothetical protein